MTWRLATFEWAGGSEFSMVWHRICLGGRICIHNLVSFDLQENKHISVQDTKNVKNFVRISLFLAHSIAELTMKMRCFCDKTPAVAVATDSKK